MYVGLFLGSLFCIIDLYIVFMSLSHCFNCCSFVIEFKIKECAVSSFALLAQDCFGYSGFFMVPYKFWKRNLRAS